MSFVYAADAQEGLLFGGNDATGHLLGDTWIYSNGCWGLQHPTPAPAIRDLAAAAYDPADGYALMYGGRGGGQFLSDTWTWKANVWSQLTSSGPPYLFAAPVMGFDPISRRPLLFGMANGGLAQTWTWNATNWTQQTPVHSPDGLESLSLALDSANGRLLLFGGYSLKRRTAVNETWTWTGSDWQQLAPTTSPPPRFRATMTSWTAKHLVILWGGVTGGTILADAWEWDGSNWKQIASPGVRSDAAAIDTGSGVLFFGGDRPDGKHNDLLTFDGVAWSAAGH